MRVAILQSNYIPWKGYFDLLASADVFVIYDEVQYTKNDWRNRNVIKTPQGNQWLTIPVKQNQLDQRIDETEVSFNKWAKKHWKTIQANYARAPHFKDFAETVENAYSRAGELTLLSDINRLFIGVICEALEIDTKILRSEDLNLEGDKNERLVDAVQKCGGTTYISGPAAKSYLDEGLFAKAGIEVEWFDYSGYPEYPQLHGEFSHGVSILDMLFNLGAETPKYTKYI